MSKYTTEVRFICENAIPLKEQGDFTDVDTAIQAGRKKIFTFDYGLFDDAYKPVIESKFLRHFYTREIGFETVALWKLKLREHWELKLPYYNRLWESALLEFNPFYDVNYTIYNTGDRYRDQNSNTRENGTKNKNGTTNFDESKSGSLKDVKTLESETTFDGNTNRSTNNNKDNRYTRDENLLDKYSDTPQGGLNGVIDTNWLTDARQNVNDIDGTDYTRESGNENSNTDNTTNVDSTDTLSRSSADNKKTKQTVRDELSTNNTTILVGNIHDMDDYQKHVIGKMSVSSYAKLLKEFRETFLNIDEMFINEMNDLFMLIY